MSNAALTYRFIKQANLNYTPLVIAGFDPTSGAGVLADNKVFASNNTFAFFITCAITAQNSTNFYSKKEIELALFKEQFRAFDAEFVPSVIKITSILSNEQIDFLAQKLAEYKQKYGSFIILDPVLKSTSNGEFTNKQNLEKIKKKLFCVIDLLTPNLFEAKEIFASINPSKIQKNLEQESFSVLLKGGHSQTDKICDVFLNSKTKVLFENQRLQSARGTGCSFASFIALYLAQKNSLGESIFFAKAALFSNLKENRTYKYQDISYMKYKKFTSKNKDIEYKLPLAFKSANTLDLIEKANKFSSIKQDEIGLYAIVSTLKELEDFLSFGIKTIQFRHKNITAKNAQLIQDAIKIANKYSANLYINDHWQLAIEFDAYGVHLGQGDLETADICAIKKNDLALGISSHDFLELNIALLYKPTYIAIGHIFATQSKIMPSIPQGIEALKMQASFLQNKTKSVAIGGINKENFLAVKEANVDGIAMISALSKSKNQQQTTKDFLEII